MPRRISLTVSKLKGNEMNPIRFEPTQEQQRRIDFEADGDVYHIESYLVKGNAFCPEPTDIIAQIGMIEEGDPIPDDWRMTDGNNFHSEVIRIVIRGDLE